MIAEQVRPTQELDAVTAPIPTAEAADEPPKSPGRALLDQMGGIGGIVYTNVPAIVFSVANAFVPLLTTTAIALGSAVALAVFRVTVRKEKLVSASGGILGVAAAGAITVWTGSPRDFFLFGIWLAFVATVALVASAVVRRPLTGLAWSWFHGRRHAWRDDRAVLRAHDVATLFAAVVFAGRFAVNQTLYLADSTGGLAVAKVVTGFPLTALMALVVIWAFRRSTKRLVTTTAGRR
jgi:hypothetical protein